MITICFVYFRSLTLMNLEAALYSVRKQNFDNVESMVMLDNNTDDSVDQIQAVIDRLDFPIPVALVSHKHGDTLRTHSWSTNAAVREAKTEWIFFTRADYLISFDTLEKFVSIRKENSFVTAKGCHVSGDIMDCEIKGWKQSGPQILQGVEYDYTTVDSGVWMTTKEAFDKVGGLNENLTAWGHAQTHFQWKLHQSGVEFIQVPEVLFFHPEHGGEKDIVLANRQLVEQGLNLHEMWARYNGSRIY